MGIKRQNTDLGQIFYLSFRGSFDKLLLSGFRDKVNAGLGQHFSDHPQMVLIHDIVPILMNVSGILPPIILKMAADVC